MDPTTGCPGPGSSSRCKGFWVSQGLSASTRVRGQGWQRRGAEGREGTRQRGTGRMREELLSAPESQEGQVRVQHSDERAGQPVTCRHKYPPKMQITAPLFRVKSRGREGPPNPVHTVTLSLVTHWAPTLFTQGAPTVLPHEARALVPQLSSHSEPEACSHAEPQPPSHTGTPHPPHTRGTNPGHTPSTDPHYKLIPEPPHSWSPNLLIRGALTLITN